MVLITGGMGHTVWDSCPVIAPDLSAAQVAGLPPRRERWIGWLGGWLAVALVCLLFAVLGDEWSFGGTEDAPRFSISWPGATLTALIGAVFLRRVGMPLWYFLGFLFPPLGLVLSWKIGHRLAQLPYRDWRPKRADYPLCRRVPGTPYYVVLTPEEAALDAAERRGAEEKPESSGHPLRHSEGPA